MPGVRQDYAPALGALITVRYISICTPPWVLSWPVGGVLSSHTVTSVVIHLCSPPGGAPEIRCERAAHPPIRPCSGWGLPSHRSYPRCWCALTAPFHPCSLGSGLLSVALSVESPRLAVSQHPALWSPDLPQIALGDPRPPGQLSVVSLIRELIGWSNG